MVNVASMAAHMMPPAMYPTRMFQTALSDQHAFLKKAMRTYRLAPEKLRPGMAYSLSKTFVRWYCTSQADRFGSRGARILSVSPGSIDTEMGRLEESTGSGALARRSALRRFGTAEEVAEVLGLLRQREGQLPHRHRRSVRRRLPGRGQPSRQARDGTRESNHPPLHDSYSQVGRRTALGVCSDRSRTGDAGRVERSQDSRIGGHLAAAILGDHDRPFDVDERRGESIVANFYAVNFSVGKPLEMPAASLTATPRFGNLNAVRFGTLFER